MVIGNNNMCWVANDNKCLLNGDKIGNAGHPITLVLKAKKVLPIKYLLPMFTSKKLIRKSDWLLEDFVGSPITCYKFFQVARSRQNMVISLREDGSKIFY